MTKDRLETAAALAGLFHPKSVALIGASPAGGGISSASLRNLIDYGFKGRIYPVNPKHSAIDGILCYPSVSSLPEVPDTAIITVPAPHVDAVLADCDACGIGSAVIMTAGYTYSANEPRRTRILGPESVGPINLVDNYFPRAGASRLRPELTKSGPLALVTRSGAMANGVFNRAQASGVGIAYAVNSGREMDLTLWDVVEFVLDEPAVDVVMVVVEGLGDVQHFWRVAQKASACHKPIVVLELGKSTAGGRAAQSHSGALTGSGAVHSAAFRELKMVEVTDWDHLWTTAGLIAAWGVPPVGRANRRIGVLALSGGEGIMIADRLAAGGIDLVMPSDDFAELLEREYPECTSQNPFDPTTRVLNDEPRWRKLITAWCTTAGFSDVLIAAPVYAKPNAERRLNPIIDALAQKTLSGARVCLSLSDVMGLTERAHELVVQSGVPFVGSSVETVRALLTHISYCDQLSAGGERVVPTETTPDLGPPIRWLAASSSEAEVSDAPLRGVQPRRDAVWCDEAFSILQQAGLTVASHVAVEASQIHLSNPTLRLRTPVTVKANVQSQVHKSLFGLVARDVRGRRKTIDACSRVIRQAEMHGIATRGVIVMEEVSADWELIVAGRFSAEFGPILVMGAGGRGVEKAADYTVGFLPLQSAAAIQRMLQRTKIGSAISELTDSSVKKGLLEFVHLFAEWFGAHWVDYSVVELNPVRIDSSGACVLVDVRIVRSGDRDSASTNLDRSKLLFEQS